ncbi:MAG TPA: tryptophan synthase subunit alpha [Burkholderiaceae bacterium]|nr:tryptophan synthase subunit alpha [Burkholderiaceae bacterium]
MSRIAARFAQLHAGGRTGLVAYIAAGDPTPALTVPLMLELSKAGADVIELGVPFSDPMADGPVIQRAAQRAIHNGVGLRTCLQMVGQFRREDTSTPVVLMGYANPIEHMGTQAFVAAAADAGVDGVIVVDYPPEECEGFVSALQRAQIDPIFLLAPTSTPERIAQVARYARGFIYYVSLKGITGAGHLDVDAVAARLPAIRAHTTLPVAVGFGIRDETGARALARVADAIVIGSRLVEEIEHSGTDGALPAARRLVGTLREALDRGTAKSADACDPNMSQKKVHRAAGTNG